MGTQNEIDEVRGTGREGDMILAPNEYAFISDETKGEVNCFVGPNKTSLAGTDRPVRFELKSKRFQSCDLASATQTFQTAPEGWYVILKNPAEGDKHPGGSGKLSTPTLRVGKKVNISGPASFPLWPGQMAKVVQGHSLRSNEYLLVRVYDEDAAKANIDKAVVKKQDDVTTSTDPKTSQLSSFETKASSPLASKKTQGDVMVQEDLLMGKIFVIRGTEVSFYIPPTGIEVVPEKVNGEERYVREAVSLERLEYCLLLDQNGNKRYVRGPDVVFPTPTEKFVEAPIKSNPDGKVKAKKFRAQELTPTSGIHIRVIADHVDDLGEKHSAGEELFITGATQPVYFPREEHAIIKYGEQDVHYGIAIPSGEARYVLNRETGVISLVKGPQIFLADPRTQVIAQRALPLSLCELLYPNNTEALAINADRLGIEDQDFMGAGGANAAYLNLSYVRSEVENENYGAVAAAVTPDTNRRILIKSASKSLPGDAFDRKSKFTAPRSVILNTKYDGAVTTTLWTGYAMLLIRKSGERRVVQGPGTYELEYDESPQVLTLSRGKPKTMDNPLKTVFLLTKANKVSDVVEVETKDFCRLNVKLSYRVNFEGDTARWFNVDNYVKFLCDHMRSRIRNAVQKLGIEEFYGNHTDILRDVILGAGGEGQVRTGTSFEENGMRIYDVEVLGVAMQNVEVEKMLVNAQREVIQNTLVLATERRKLDYTTETEKLKQQTEVLRADTARRSLALQAESARLKHELDLETIAANAKTEQDRIANELVASKARSEVSDVARQVQAANDAQRNEQLAKQQELELQKTRAQVEAIVEKAKAISPDFIAALNAFGERAMIEKVSAAMAPMALLGGDSVMDVMKKLLEGTALGKHLEPVTLNGSVAKPSTRSRTTATD